MTETYTPPVRRRNHGKGHSYVDALGRKVPGVTTVIGDGVPKPALINWSANVTADYALDHWDELTAVAPSERLARLRKARFADRDGAAKRGTEVHSYAERTITGEAVSPPDEIAGHVEAYVRFLDEWRVEAVLTEFVIVSHTHGYAGTCDLVADLADPDAPDDAERRVRWLLDVKTSRSGVYGETALQLAAYRYADVYMSGPRGAEVELPIPAVQRTGVVHVRADGYDLVPVNAEPRQHRAFLYAQQVARFAASSRELIGDALIPPHLTEVA